MEFYEFTDFRYPDKKVLINKDCKISSIYWADCNWALSLSGSMTSFIVLESKEEIMKILNGESISKEILNVPIDFLELTFARDYYLKDSGIYLIGDLIRKTEKELLKIRRIGKKYLREIKEKLAIHGLSLKA